jgi:hypothetical protein
MLNLLSDGINRSGTFKFNSTCSEKEQLLTLTVRTEFSALQQVVSSRKITGVYNESDKFSSRHEIQSGAIFYIHSS